MPSPAASRSLPSPARNTARRGALLVEAVISAVVIAVGLVGVSRALSAQLQAMESVSGYAVATTLAQRLSMELERSLQAGVPPPTGGEGTFEPPYEGYGWRLQATPLAESSTGVPVSRVTLTVRPEAQGDRPAWSVQSVWPSELVPSSWL